MVVNEVDGYGVPASITRCSLNQVYPSLSRIWNARRNLGFAPSIIRVNTSVLSLSHPALIAQSSNSSNTGEYFHPFVVNPASLYSLLSSGRFTAFSGPG